MEELAEIRKRTDLEIEAFVHGAMCISYSGRCTFQPHVRPGWWLFSILLLEIRPLRHAFGQERARVSKGKVPEEYSMSAVDI